MRARMADAGAPRSAEKAGLPVGRRPGNEGWGHASRRVGRPPQAHRQEIPGQGPAAGRRGKESSESGPVNSSRGVPRKHPWARVGRIAGGANWSAGRCSRRTRSPVVPPIERRPAGDADRTARLFPEGGGGPILGPGAQPGKPRGGHSPVRGGMFRKEFLIPWNVCAVDSAFRKILFSKHLWLFCVVGLWSGDGFPSISTG